MGILIILFIFIFGTIIGSFLNVVILRHNTGLDLKGRSFCPICDAKLKWYELIPVFSFLIQKRRCRSCGVKISLQYPLVEFLTGILFVGVVLKFAQQIMILPSGFESFSDEKLILGVLVGWIIVSLLVVISVYDIKHKIIPNKFVYTFAFLALAYSLYILDAIVWTDYLWHFLYGIILATPFALLWFFSKGNWMGLGDAKLALGIGWLLGIYGGINAIILSFFIGAIVGLLLIFWSEFKKTVSKKKEAGYNMKSEIPFGPFMIFALLLVYFFNVNVILLNGIF